MDGLIASIGAFTGIYATDLPPRRLAAKLAAVGLGLTAAFALGALAAGRPLAAALSVAGVGGIATYVAGALEMAPPGPFFFIMAAAIAAGQPQAHAGTFSAELILSGAGVAFLLSLLLAVAWPSRLRGQAQRLHRSGARRVMRKLRIHLRLKDATFSNALRMSVGLCAASLAAQALDSPRGYWTAVGCAATLVGTTVMGTLHRAIQRALGSVIGVLVASVILSLHLRSLALAMCLFALQTLAELFIARNYGIAVIFITPLAMLIAEASPTGLDPHAALFWRLADTLLGCAMGLAIRLLWHIPSRRLRPSR